MALFIAHNEEFFKLYDAMGDDNELQDQCIEIDKEFSETFFNDRDMEEARKKWDQVEDKEELIKAIFEITELHDLYKDHEYDDEFFADLV